MKKLLYSTAFIATTFFGLSSYAQVSLDRDVVATAGVSTTTGFQVSWTLGEFAVTYHNPGLILSEGFQQVDAASQSGITETDFNASVSIFPNPVTDILNYQIEGFENQELTGSIVDLLGREVINIPNFTVVSSFNGQVDMSELPAGTWILNLRSVNGALSKQFKIVKL
ncbi:T9SS type A sorting domain-containing protein [Paracrocinitomix mangrovi]|uniref:T9SS type A sorting domain-containing protein n=1 Tax=Paracrocinitomix mangrovi TaxID=2862509 RepID=UPI001C8EBE4B|nr:T9SS type A sorting domain-containing protein [Paracrocinitomix mangrovi]UKN02744.1 T9SS type A sorting domain-containing protein [Paracrocinitomix mangrovi]